MSLNKKPRVNASVSHSLTSNSLAYSIWLSRINDEDGTGVKCSTCWLVQTLVDDRESGFWRLAAHLDILLNL